ncbi:putative trafficking protein particle complex subunit 10 [Phytophthora cinnamomi]|uniref:putative trafficking protein particle complex subunit 10 n=1 Tax=Phytophthora cinnamomi TaxID=4785 RepID=UPI00355A50F8|nr:putative trafficking protein particle complex subunit 10 [Phytophthora cinnamomi]
MTSLYASVAPQFTRALLSPGLRVGVADEGGVWQFVAPALAQRLPLRAIEWRNLVGVTKRIEQLPLHFLELRAGGAQEPPPTCVYLVKCEDLDAYRSAVRPPLAAWVDAMTAARVEWLVLYVPLGTRAKAAGNQPNAVYRKVFERLRADFAHPRRGGALLIGAASAAASASSASSAALQERVCKIETLEGASVLGQQQQHESQWTELLLRLRRCVMDAFQTRCFQYEERLRVLDNRRGAAGWDFGAFFLAKERLALMYQQMYLQDDAIRHLDELDAIFVNLNETEKQAFRDGSKRSFAAQDAIFTQSPLALDLNETQELIASNRASARLISLYCFCRQIRTLYVMGNFPQLLQRASLFIESFLEELKEMAAEGTLEWHQPFLWAVGACLEVAYACELSWSGRDEEWTASSVSVQAAQTIPVEDMSRALGSVLYLARRLLKGFAKSNRSRMAEV